MTRRLLIIDIQHDYAPGDAYPLREPEAAAAAAAAAARCVDRTVRGAADLEFSVAAITAAQLLA
jgi:nicotinamidase-related amidase